MIISASLGVSGGFMVKEWRRVPHLDRPGSARGFLTDGLTKRLRSGKYDAHGGRYQPWLRDYLAAWLV